jgi:hypothetical protein
MLAGQPNQNRIRGGANGVGALHFPCLAEARFYSRTPSGDGQRIAVNAPPRDRQKVVFWVIVGEISANLTVKNDIAKGGLS